MTVDRARHRRRPGTATARLTEIDLLRIGAAGAVLVYHYVFSGAAGGLTGLTFPGWDQLARYGYLGVDLFFLISGFVVLLSAWDRAPAAFVISRVVRLYPAYWVAVTLTTVVTVAFGRDLFTVGPWQYLANLTMLNSLVDVRNIDVVYWTLWAELRFYAIVLLLTLVGVTGRRVSALLWLWLGGTVLVQAGLLPAVADLVLNTEYAHYFIAGMALCLVRHQGLTWSSSAILAGCLANAVYRGTGFAAGVAERYQAEFHTPVVVAGIVAIFAVMTLVATGRLRRWARPWFTGLGALTYPLYLIHAHVGFIAFARLEEHVDRHVLLAGTTAAMVAGAYAIHRLVEQPVAPWLRHRLDALRRPRGRRAGA